MVEAMMNICGVTLLQQGYGAFEDFNLRKFQATHCSDSSDNNNKNSSTNNDNTRSTSVNDTEALHTDNGQEIEAIDDT